MQPSRWGSNMYNMQKHEGNALYIGVRLSLQCLARCAAWSCPALVRARVSCLNQSSNNDAWHDQCMHQHAKWWCFFLAHSRVPHSCYNAYLYKEWHRLDSESVPPRHATIRYAITASAFHNSTLDCSLSTIIATRTCAFLWSRLTKLSTDASPSCRLQSRTASCEQRQQHKNNKKLGSIPACDALHYTIFFWRRARKKGFFVKCGDFSELRSIIPKRPIPFIRDEIPSKINKDGVNPCGHG